MSKLSSSERFFIDMAALGMESSGDPISEGDIQLLLSSGLNCCATFKHSCISALSTTYKSPGFPKELVEDQIKKIYCGRENLLRDIVLQWYKETVNPPLFERLKKLVQG